MPAFYDFDGERYLPRREATGPWSPEHQHGGPPTALMARACERLAPEPGVRVARLTLELLRPIPLRPLTVRAELATAGRIAQRVAVSLWDGARELARGLALRLRGEPMALPPIALELEAPRPPEACARVADLDFGIGDVGYHTAVELRVERGVIGRGPVRVWMRPLVELVAGEAMTPLERVMVCADSGNGVSQVLDPRRFSFVNADLGVHLHRLPDGEWVGLESRTLVAPDGIGEAETRLWDARGPFGRGQQMLVVRGR